jgi:hypothetical protein
MQNLRIATVGFVHGDRKWSLNDRQIPKNRGVRVHVSKGYNHVEGNRRASRNGRVSDLPPETLRFATFLIATGRTFRTRGWQRRCPTDAAAHHEETQRPGVATPVPNDVRPVTTLGGAPPDCGSGRHSTVSEAVALRSM